MQHFYTLVLLFALSSIFVPPVPARDTASRSGEPSAGHSAPTKTAKGTKSKTKPPKGREGGRKKRSPRKPIAPPDYAQWEQLNMGSRRISRDGQWLVFGIRRVDEKGSLHLHRIQGGKSEEKEVFPQGERPVFSNDSNWLAVTMGQSPEEKKKAKSSKAPPSPGNTVKLRSLANGKTTEFENVGAVVFSDDSRFAAIEVIGKAPPPRPGSPPSQPAKALLVRNLATGDDTTFGNVTRFTWSRQDALLALVVDSPSISNSLQLFDPEKETLRTLESSDQDYVGLLWRKDSFDLAATRQMKFGDKEDISHTLLAFRDLDEPATPAGSAAIYDHSKDRSFSPAHYITPTLSWAQDGRALHCSLKKWENRPKDFPSPPEPTGKKRKGRKDKKQKASTEEDDSTKKPAKREEPSKNAPKEKPKETGAKSEAPAKTLRETLTTPSNVEVWHSRDATIMPRQKKEASKRKNPARKAVWWIAEEKLVQLENELTERVTITKDGRRAIGLDASPHERSAMFGPSLHDVYAINTSNGKRNRILEGVKFTLSTSPDGRFLLFLREGQVWSHDLRNGKQRNLTARLKPSFTDQKDDTLATEKRPFGNGVWLTDSSAVLLYDRYDIWLLDPRGERARKLTDGREQEIRHRLSRASFREDNDGALAPGDRLYIGLSGERTKKSGYGTLTLGDRKHPAVDWETHLLEDTLLLYLERARDAEVFTFTRERTDQSRNLFLSGPGLKSSRQVTTTNEFQKNYHWGRSELVNFRNKQGVPLQGMLTYPAGYRKGKKYPMIVYIYEKRSQDLHRYYTPSEKHPYNPCVFSAEGYFVFQPDIVYRPQKPGISAVDCVVPAVEKVLETGMVDSRRVGLMGHSWGAYQTSFIVTRTDLFSAAVAGAPLTDLMSMSVSVYWNSGGTNARIFAQSQGRMNKPFWQDAENYARNSPIHGLDTLNTPLLIAFGDKDGAVDWDQGIEMYNAARWAGKDDVVLLVYPGENHGLRKEENMVDYHYRVREWMAHFLKDETGRKWITEGKSFLAREKEKEELKKKDSSKPAPGKPQAEAGK
ncbi:MAG: prolyl oligopeptidase family serine peptidase [Roseibacillus sp.]|nr:prolyl oligopeptidase family serine peptidase [Roseibacillus sp.]